MLARAVIVLLVVLNLGVAAWWLSGGSAAAPPPPPASPDDVPRLRLLSEVPPAQRPAAPPPASVAPPPTPMAESAAAQAPAASEPPPEAPVAPPLAANAALPPGARCLAIGPFADAAVAGAARSRLQAGALRLRDRVQSPPAARGWRVWMPPQADNAAAVALAARLREAGFADQYVLGAGEDANAVALGRFGSESAARQREAAVRAAGFAEVRAAPLGGQPLAAPQRWVDVAFAATGPSSADLRELAGAPRADSVDCAALR